jgi:hypothetical protein
VLLPFTKEAVPEVDIEGGRLVVAPLRGLFGSDSEPEADTGQA